MHIKCEHGEYFIFWCHLKKCDKMEIFCFHIVKIRFFFAMTKKISPPFVVFKLVLFVRHLFYFFPQRSLITELRWVTDHIWLQHSLLTPGDCSGFRKLERTVVPPSLQIVRIDNIQDTKIGIHVFLINEKVFRRCHLLRQGSPFNLFWPCVSGSYRERQELHS